jgi:penicillin amidase
MTLLLWLSGCAVTTMMTQGRSLPTLAGEVEAEGLAGKVTVTRDEHGVPHVRAGSEADAAYGVGYVHAQDRLFQMDMARRLAYGHLSELLGEDYVQLDTFMQSLQLEARAAEAIKAMDPDTRFALAAYAQGVNAGREAAKSPTLEHRLLKEDRVAEWKPTDSMALVFLNSWWLATSIQTELFAWTWRSELDRDDLNAMFQSHAADPKVDPYWNTLRKARTGDLNAAASAFFGSMSGYKNPGNSNNWVVSGERSLDGKPIVANDPHLLRQVPAPWYLVDYKGGDTHAAGATIAGLPWVVVGHNDGLAWGATNVMADYVDLAVVERDGTMDYILAGQKKTLEERRVEVGVKDVDDPVAGSVYWTEIGPVISELSGSHLLVLRWNVLETTDLSAGYLHGLNRAQTVEQALALGGEGTTTSLNIVMGDTEGHIGWKATGALPDRTNHTGRVPYPASSEHHGWDGWLEGLPSEVDPERGYIVTANNRPDFWSPPEELVEADEGAITPVTDLSLISTEWAQDYRAARIAELIEATPQHDPASIAAIQLDLQDGHARRYVPTLEALDPKTEGARNVWDVLMAWDYESTRSSKADLPWMHYNKELVRYALQDKLPAEGIEMYLWATVMGNSLPEVEGGLGHFMEDTDMARRAALLEAWKVLEVEVGPSPSDWRWSDHHALTFEHPFVAGGAPVSMNAGTADVGGSVNTVNPGGYSWRRGTETTWIASLRLVMPLANLPGSQAVLPPGQSGQPASGWYQDQLRFWRSGDLLPLWYADADVQANGEHELVLSKP